MEDILQRLPHRPPFVMIDRIAVESGIASAQFLIRGDNVLIEAGFFSESGLIENMAQTAGAGLPQPATGAGPSVGYIGALKDLHVSKLPTVGELITTKVTYVHHVMNAHIVQATVYNAAHDLLASCELKIFVQA